MNSSVPPPRPSQRQPPRSPRTSGYSENIENAQQQSTNSGPSSQLSGENSDRPLSMTSDDMNYNFIPMFPAIQYASSTSTRLGTAQMAGGILAMIDQAGHLFLTYDFNASNYYAGFWCGIFFLVTGLIGIAAGRYNRASCIVIYLTLAIITAALFSVILCVLCILAVVDARASFIDTHYDDPGYEQEFYILLALLVVLIMVSIMEFIVCIMGAIICCKAFRELAVGVKSEDIQMGSNKHVSFTEGGQAVKVSGDEEAGNTATHDRRSWAVPMSKRMVLPAGQRHSSYDDADDDDIADIEY